MNVWRLCSSKHTSFDGEGSRLYGGRWNGKGTRMVYTSGSRSLALIEKLVHADSDLLPDDLVFIGAEFPDNLVETMDPNGISPNWRETPAPPELAAFGSQWAAENRSLALRVPSVPMPYEYNCLLNPAHPDFARNVVLGAAEPFSFDPPQVVSHRLRLCTASHLTRRLGKHRGNGARPPLAQGGSRGSPTGGFFIASSAPSRVPAR
jgi:RES domain-containing protein